MLKYRVSGDNIVMRLEEDEKIVESLEEVCSKEKVTAGVILSAVGAVKRGTLVYRKGCQGDFEDHLEIIGSGNVSTVEGKVKIHLHISGGNEKGVKAGHLVEGTVTVFCEIAIQRLKGFEMKRNKDESLVKQNILSPYVLEP